MTDDPTGLTADLTDEADQDEIERELDAAYPPPRDLSRQAALVSAGLTVVAAVLCVVAPFRDLYVLASPGFRGVFDGWGRYAINGVSTPQHGARYGIALTVAAVVLVIAAASRLRDLRPSAMYDEQDDTAAGTHPEGGGPGGSGSTDARLAAGIGIAGAALLLGVLASVALNIESTVSNADTIAANGGARSSVDVGGMLWILVGAWVVSLLALYVPWYESRRRV